LASAARAAVMAHWRVSSKVVAVSAQLLVRC
jgi:hypothetical protein